MLDALRHDVRYGVRMLAKTPGVTAVAVLTLALGVGATSAIFSVLNAVMLRPLPFPDPEQLVWVGGSNLRDGEYRPPDVATLLAWRDQSRSFEQLGMIQMYGGPAALPGEGGGETIGLQVVGLNAFRVLGAEPVLGRSFRADEVLIGPRWCTR